MFGLVLHGLDRVSVRHALRVARHQDRPATLGGDDTSLSLFSPRKSEISFKYTQIWRKGRYLCAVKDRDVLDLVDLVEDILRTSDVDTVGLC